MAEGQYPSCPELYHVQRLHSFHRVITRVRHVSILAAFSHPAGCRGSARLDDRCALCIRVHCAYAADESAKTLSPNFRERCKVLYFAPPERVEIKSIRLHQTPCPSPFTLTFLGTSLKVGAIHPQPELDQGLQGFPFAGRNWP